MDDTGQRLRNCAENCINAYDAWQGSRQNVAARESLQEAVHELRKVAAKLEIEVAISEREELTQRPIPIPPHRAARRRDQNGSELPDFLMDGPRAPRAPGSQGSQGNDFSSDDEGDMEAQSSNFASPSEGRSGGRSGSQNRHMGQRRVGQNRRPPQSQNQSERSSNQQDRQNSASADSAPKEFNPQPPREREPRDTPPNREGTMSLGNMNTIASNNPAPNPAPATENSGPIQSSQPQTHDEQ